MKKKQFIAGLMVTVALSGAVLAHVTLNGGKVSKASTPGATMQTSSVETVDAALKENQEEEKYVVELVSKLTNKELATKDWKECLEYLEANYETVMADETVDTDKVASYVEGYRYVLNDINGVEQAPETVENTEVVTSARNTEEVATGTNNGYDVNKVLEYINEYWQEPNPEYPNYNGMGGDCACFVSQCLHAGGKQMVGTNAASFSNWFCRTNDRNQFSKVSSTWRGAEAFAAYWKKNALEYKDFEPSYFEDRLTFRDVYRYANPGDPISFINSNGRPYHTVMVSYKNRDNDREIRFAAHTSPQLDKSLFDYCKGGTKTVRVYRMTTPDPALEASYDYDMENTYIEVLDSNGENINIAPQEQSRKSFWNRLFGR